MQIEELKTFVAVIDQKNFTKAAVLLKLAQPTVSLHIKNLEETLQTSLLKRTSRSFQVTPAGQLLYERAVQLIDLADRTKMELTRPQSSAAGLLRIAASPVIAEGILPDVLTRLHAKFPELYLRLEVISAHSIDDVVHNKKADIGCSEVTKTTLANTFMEDELLLVAVSGHPLARKKSSSILDLQETHWILPNEEDPERDLIDSSLTQFGVHPKHTVISSPEGRKRAVLSGLGIAFLSRHSCKRELERGELAALNYKVAPIRRPFYSLVNENSLAATALLDELHAYCRLWSM
ncbi:LysR family transcriptional regulator [Sporosarcina cascadiensis]|uniref:LysR family transcriptional regulator n=1 Tax=Sporosarcina cascadiensis TaxID=2660747 RepID=UPI00129A3D93|nr:LysR family transcriptional regulator [Sporosarcina cascadiensis]